ncbi:hypothetical protein SME36J_34470 [Serratia marcescens]|nr:hypothetical protein SME36J_34470 [Serratia marcescens]
MQSTLKLIQPKKVAISQSLPNANYMMEKKNDFMQKCMPRMWRTYHRLV